MFSQTVARVSATLLISLALMACSGLQPREVPVVTKARPSVDLLRLCEEPERPARSKTVQQNSAAIVDMEIKFDECAERQAKLVGWFEDDPKVGGGRE